MNARLIARCTGPRPFDGACGFLRRVGWCGHFVMVCREFSTSAPLAMNARLIARCTGPRPFDGACGFLRRFGWCGHFVMVCRSAFMAVAFPRINNIDCIDDVALFIKSKAAIATHVFPL